MSAGGGLGLRVAGVVVGEEGSVDDLDDLALEGPEGLVGRLAFGEFVFVVVRPGPGRLIWVRATRWMAVLRARLPPRLTRWRVLGPLEVSRGAVPVELA
jgi:hypothetical protein